MYVGEIVSEVGLGICLFVLMVTLTLLTLIAPILVTGDFGVANTFYALAVI